MGFLFGFQWSLKMHTKVSQLGSILVASVFPCCTAKHKLTFVKLFLALPACTLILPHNFPATVVTLKVRP